MGELVAVEGDPESHGHGELICDNNPGKLTIGGLKVALVNSKAQPDLAGHPAPPTDAATGTANFTVLGLEVHRNNDSRYCGALTIVQNQSKVTSG